MLGLEIACERVRHGVLAVVYEHELRFFLKSGKPRGEPVAVGVAALAGQEADLAVDLDILAEELYVFFAVIELSAERPLRLIADEEHRALLPPEVVLEMVADASRLAHAAR